MDSVSLSPAARQAVHEAFIYLWSGHYGSGKTLMAVSYKPHGVAHPKRLVIDAEVRAIRYQAEQHGYDQDTPDKLLYSFDFFPNALDEISKDDFLNLMKMLQGKKPWPGGGGNGPDPVEPRKPDVIIFDNFALFQGSLEGWCQEAGSAGQLVDVCGLRTRYDGFLKYRFKVEPGWWRMVKDIIREFFRACKRAEVDVIVTTEQKNEWENYGVRGNGPDGKPLQRIVGQTAKVHDVVFQMADTCWNLTRNAEKLTDTPEVTLDPLNPKMSVVGVPPKFKFHSWDEIWHWVEERQVATADQLGQVKRPDPKFTESEQGEPFDPIEEGRKRLVAELMAQDPTRYPNRRKVAEALQAMGMSYTVEDHDTIRAKALAYNSPSVA
jgi:hypothetical protein